MPGVEGMNPRQKDLKKKSLEAVGRSPTTCLISPTNLTNLLGGCAVPTCATAYRIHPLNIPQKNGEQTGPYEAWQEVLLKQKEPISGCRRTSPF